jgi:hypothetical protein
LYRQFLSAATAANLQQTLAQWLQHLPGLAPSIKCRRRFRTVDPIDKRQVYGGYRVTEVVNNFPESSNDAIPHNTYHWPVRMNNTRVMESPVTETGKRRFNQWRYAR